MMRDESEIRKAHDVCERLYLSVRFLAVGEDDVRKRLSNIASTLLCLRVEDFPNKLQSEYKQILKRLTKYPPRHKHETLIDASCSRMRKRTGHAIADKIFQLYEDAMKIQGKPLI